jgi:hypothetical protein
VIAAALAQTAGEPVRAPLRLEAPIQDKNFYLLSLIERTPVAAQALQTEAGLSAVARRKREALAKAFPACAPEPTCAIEPFRFTPEESTETATALRHIYKDSEAVRRLVDGPLHQSGAYVRLHGRGGDDLLVAAWLEAAKGINNIIDVYGYGRAPRYPLIDSASFDVKTAEYHSAIHTAAGTLGEQAGDLKLFFQPSLRFALYLLELNREMRQDATSLSKPGTIRPPFAMSRPSHGTSFHTPLSLSPAPARTGPPGACLRSQSCGSISPHEGSRPGKLR